MLSITALWKAEIEVFNCSLKYLLDAELLFIIANTYVRCRGAVLHLMTNICNQMQKSWHVDYTLWQVFVRCKSLVLFDKDLWSDAKVVYFMTNICEMQGRAGGKYLTVDTSHSPQWQSATTQGCPWPRRRGNAFWIKVENNSCCSFVHSCANAVVLGCIGLSLSPAPNWRANVHFLSHVQPICF